MNHLADQADDVLRISMDAKAIVKVGPFARGGKSRSKLMQQTTIFSRRRL